MQPTTTPLPSGATVRLQRLERTALVFSIKDQFWRLWMKDLALFVALPDPHARKPQGSEVEYDVIWRKRPFAAVTVDLASLREAVGRPDWRGNDRRPRALFEFPFDMALLACGLDTVRGRKGGVRLEVARFRGPPVTRVLRVIGPGWRVGLACMTGSAVPLVIAGSEVRHAA